MKNLTKKTLLLLYHIIIVLLYYCIIVSLYYYYYYISLTPYPSCGAHRAICTLFWAAFLQLYQGTIDSTMSRCAHEDVSWGGRFKHKQAWETLLYSLQ